MSSIETYRVSQRTGSLIHCGSGFLRAAWAPFAAADEPFAAFSRTEDWDDKELD